MNWLDIDRNGTVDGRDFYILSEIIGLDDEKEAKDELFSDYDEDDENSEDAWL